MLLPGWKLEKICYRSFHHSGVSLIKIRQSYGPKIAQMLLERPRKPIPLFLKYAVDKSEEMKEKFPNFTFKQRRDYLIEEWKTLPKEQKEIYVKSYLQDLKEYRERQKSYEADLSDDEKVIIKRVCKENHARIALEKALGAPNRPAKPYALFVGDLAKMKVMSSTRGGAMKDSVDDYHALPEEKKKEYSRRYLEMKIEYDKQYEAWKIRIEPVLISILEVIKETYEEVPVIRAPLEPMPIPSYLKDSES
ncbi:transcription factor A, mitochondrial-like isoform X3 [Artemia franciscana]|uniref:transcription factor A, mitochondrial-like isoform X3 n=1 Tax=Artemia franciscana TaxID=6661 RepID=UPI0032D9E4DA